jgi:hypothetical protein
MESGSRIKCLCTLKLRIKGAISLMMMSTIELLR